MKSQFEFTLKMYSPHLANRFTMRLSVLRFVVENKCSCFTAKPVLMPISYTVLFSDSFRHSLKSDKCRKNPRQRVFSRGQGDPERIFIVHRFSGIIIRHIEIEKGVYFDSWVIILVRDFSRG
jgi:hypothetical protein